MKSCLRHFLVLTTAVIVPLAHADFYPEVQAANS